MRIRYRRWSLGLALFCGVVAVQQNGDNKAFAQGTPLPQPSPLPTPPGGYPAPAPGGLMVPGQSYGEGRYSEKAPVGAYTAPSVLAEERALPINLATALRLANAQAWDIGIAAQQIRVASAQLTQANVLWLPTLVAGVDFYHNSGTVQNPITGTFTPGNANYVDLGGSPQMVFATTEAIFEPLIARQVVKARKADLQSATNDTTFNVAKAYFTVQEARGNLAGTLDTIQKTKDILRRIDDLAPGLVPDLEKARARAQLAQFEQTEQRAREQWNVVSAELLRIIRLDPAAVVVPVEPPHIQVTLVSPEQPLDNLLPVALAARPELVSLQALTQAALKRWKEEQFRPALPSVYIRGGSNQLPDTTMFGAVSGGPSGNFGGFRSQTSYEVEVMWELRNLGFGNAAAMRGRRAEYDVTRMKAYQLQDFVAREVAETYAQVRSARARVSRAEEELRQAEISALLNYKGLGELSRLNGNIIGLVIRPQEALAAMQALLQAYNDYYGTVGDYNRSQFALYRALGNPAQLLSMLDEAKPGCNSAPTGNPSPPPPASPPAPSAPGVGNEVSRSATNTTGGNTVTPAGGTVEAASATMLVRVPTSAEVYCDGVRMTLTGSERNFVSPPLPPGRTYPYEIRIRWIDTDGKTIEQSRQVQVQAGQKTTVDFMARNPN